MLPETIKSAVNDFVPKGVSHVGIVIKNLEGHLLILQPEGKPYGVTATLPRIKVQTDEEPFRTLERCLMEKVGVPTLSAYPIMNVWTTENSSTFYFVGMVQEEIHTRNGCFQWCRLDEAEALLQSSINPTTRNRDIAVLKSAAEINPSSFRRILLMIPELHGMGFGRLRAATWSHQNGYIPPPGRWSCAIVPATVMDANNGAITDDDWINRLRASLGMEKHYDPFETFGDQKPFNWPDAAFDSPRELAKKFAARFTELCYMGWGVDPAYERWYNQMLNTTAPHGVFYPVVDENNFVRSAYTAEDVWIEVPPTVVR